MTGKTISHYKIIDKLGAGGMGEVYKAEDTKLERTVALKFLPPEWTRDPDAKTRFLHEARAVSKLDHLNICTVYEINETDDGQLFIAMAYYDGESLAQKIVGATGGSPMPINDAIDIANQIAQGLQRAHEAGIIHRDIKPANIMITDRDEVKIVDFGLAKAAGRTQLTKEGSTLGTVAHMSPEQVHGEPTDRRTDIWALGVVLYEMLTGKLPFDAAYDQAIMYRITNEEPEPITGLRTGVPMELEQVVSKCLEKDAAKRYQHIDEVLVDLRRVCENLSTKKNALRSAATRKVKSAFLWPAVILSALVLAIVSYYFFGGTEAESTERFPIAVVDFINETDEKELDSLTELLITALEQSRRLAVLPRASMFGMLSRLGKDNLTTFDESLVREICERQNINAMAMASIRKFGKIYTIDLKIMDLQKNKYLLTVSRNVDGQENIPALLAKLADETREGLQEVAEEIRAHSANIIESAATNLEAYNHYFQGMQFYYQGKWRDAQDQYEQAIAVDSTFGLAYMRLAMLYDWSGVQMELEDARKINQKALNLIDKIPEKERYLLKASDIMLNDSRPIRNGMRAAISVLMEMEKRYPDDRDMLFLTGDYAFHTSQNRMSSEYFDRFLEIEPDGFRNRDVLGHRLALYLRHNQFDEAEAFMNAQSIDLHPPPSDRFFGEGQPLELYIYRGQYRKVLQIADRHIEWAMQNNRPEEAVIYGMKVILLIHGWGDKDAAQRQVEKGGRFLQSPGSYNIYYQILLGDYEKSEKMVAEGETNFPSDFRAAFKMLRQIQQGECEKAIVMADSLLNPIKERRFYDLNYALSFCYSERGQAEKAIVALEEIQDVENTSGWPSVWARALFYAKSFYALGKIYEQRGDTLRAIENYEKFIDLWKDADEDLLDLIDAKLRYARLKGE